MERGLLDQVWPFSSETKFPQSRDCSPSVSRDSAYRSNAFPGSIDCKRRPGRPRPGIAGIGHHRSTVGHAASVARPPRPSAKRDA